jgi:hypothetical protein
MPTLARLDTPGRVRDVTDAARLRQWSREQSARFDQAVAGIRGAGRTPQFYNPTRVATDPRPARKLITWPGFPRALLLRFGADRTRAYRAAERLQGSGRDRFRPQDEYLEWHARRDPETGKITRVELTCEGPEYWQFLARVAPDVLLALYRRHVSPDATRAQLMPRGDYNPGNAWNTARGAMHLTHPANSLGAEIKLAADATVLRRRGDRVLTDADELIACAGFGERRRASDPRIGADVNALARDGYAITLADPVALYIVALETQGWRRPDGKPVGDYLRITRGRPGRALRAVYEVPARARAGGRRFVVGDIEIGGRPIEWGGQVAERVTVGLVGVATRKGGIGNPAVACAGRRGVPGRLMPEGSSG